MKKKFTDKNQRNNYRRNCIVLIIILALLVFVAFTIIIPAVQEKKAKIKYEDISYSEMFQKLEELGVEKIEEIRLYPETNKVNIYINEENIIYVVRIPDTTIFMETYNNTEISKNIKFEVLYPENEAGISSFLSSGLSLFMTLILLASVVTTYRRLNPKTEETMPSDTSIYSFRDVAGIDQERWEVEEVVEMLKNPDKYRSTGAKIPKGILLSGEPGTGKTLISKAIAGEAGVKFYECAGSNFDNMFVGVGASKVRSLFKTARKNAPAIIFIDEIDAVAKQRNTNGSYSDQTLNQLLVEMDGFTESENVIVIAATNHIEVLDSAIIRPGRFDRIINIPLPDCKGREEILKVHARKKKFENEEEKIRILKELAKKTSRMSGAVLENMLNEAAIIAVRNNKTYISEDEIDEAFIKIVAGISKCDKEVSESQKLLTAVHEAGHVISSRIKRPEVEILQVSIIPRGNAGGYTLFADKSENVIVRKEDLIADIITSLGGRAAEQKYFKSISAGAYQDLKDANKVAHRMVYSFAMGNGSQLVRMHDEQDFNNRLEQEMFSDMKNIVNTAYDDALEIMKNNFGLLSELAEALIEKSTLNSSEIEEIFSKFNV